MSKLEALEVWKSAPADQMAFMARVAEGEPPKKICEAHGLPYSALMKHLKATPSLLAEYRSALETWVEALAHQTIELADGVAGSEDAAAVSAAKLAVDTRFRLASKLYREMFGEEVRAPVTVNLNLGDMAREIRELEAKLGVALPKPVEALPAPAAEIAAETVVEAVEII